MKINWGTKIATVYIGFVCLIGFMVYLSFTQKYDLVTEDYYAKEIAFQDKIDSRERAQALDQNLVISVEGQNLKIDFPHQPGEQIEGAINCFRPSDQSMDFSTAIDAAEAVQRIPLSKFTKGKYLIKVEWSVEGEKYYQENIVIIP